MAWDITAISAYVSELEFELMSKVVLKTDLANYVQTRVGLKGMTEKIPLLSGDFNLADGLACGFDGSSNNTDITQVTMNLVSKKYQSELCSAELQSIFMGQYLSAGQNGQQEDVPFAELVANYYVEKAANYVETFLTQGDGTVDGIEDLVQVANGAVAQTTVTPAAWSSSNAIAQAQSLYEALPAKSQNMNDLIMIVSPEYKRALALNITQTNYFHISPDSDEVFVPGTNVRVVANAGLSGRDYACVGPASAIIYGTDLTGDFEEFRIWYSQDNDTMRTQMRFKLGVAITETDLFAENTL